jgi:hypothetical protein
MLDNTKGHLIESNGNFVLESFQDWDEQEVQPAQPQILKNEQKLPNLHQREGPRPLVWYVQILRWC